MNKIKSFLIVGGDLRQIYLAKKLASEGFDIYVAGFDKNVVSGNNINLIESMVELSERVDSIVLPLPVSYDGVFVNSNFGRTNISLSTLTSSLKDNGLVFGGKFDSASRNIFKQYGIDVIDYFEREELNVLNAVPTAEGAVQIALEELATTLYGIKVLITGYGRISKALVKILIGFGADVYVCARKYSDIAWAEISGCKAFHISKLKDNIEKFDLIFNTVPAVIFDEECLGLVKKESLIIDLASKPGGVDFETAGNLGIKAVWALSLPGKCAPISSGEIIAYTILNILNERGMADD